MTATAAPPAVTFDHAISTRHFAVYRVPSRSHTHITYRTTHHLQDDTWNCECPGFTFRRTCYHVDAARAHEQRRWWRAFWPTCSDAVLADAQRTYALQTIEDTLTDEGAIALAELRRFLAEREAVGA